MRFLHIADVHLDTSFTGRSDAVRARLREASRRAFRRAVDLSVREEVDALLVAGDLFDGERLSFQTERFLLEQAERLHDHRIALVYATGNHDPGASDVGPRGLSWPPNVRVAGDGTPRRFQIQNHLGKAVGHVTAIGHGSATETSDLSRAFPPPKGELPEVALLHTQVHSSAGSEAHGAYAPSELTYLRHAGYDYWALGHVHMRQQLSDDPPIWYAGSLQGRNHAEQGERGALLVDLSDRALPRVAFRPLAPVRWETVEIDRLDGVDSLDALERVVQVAWNARREADPGISGTDWMVRVVLGGPCPLWAELREHEDVEVLARELRELVGALDVTVLTDDVHPVFSVDEHRARTDVLGEALRLAATIERGERTLTNVRASELAGARSDDPAEVARYVREVLSGVEGEIAARLLAPERP